MVLETVHCCVQCELGIDLPNVDMISTRNLYYDMTMSRHGNTFSITGPLPVRGMHWWLVYSPHKGPVPVYSPHKVTIILVAFMIVASALIKVSWLYGLYRHLYTQLIYWHCALLYCIPMWICSIKFLSPKSMQTLDDSFLVSLSMLLNKQLSCHGLRHHYAHVVLWCHTANWGLSSYQ